MVHLQKQTKSPKQQSKATLLSYAEQKRGKVKILLDFLPAKVGLCISVEGEIPPDWGFPLLGGEL